MSLRVAAVEAAVTAELRRAVLRPNWPPGSRMQTDEDPAAVHLAALDGGTVVGCCVLLPRPYPPRPDEPDAWQLRGMATAPDRQRQGIGGLVVEAAAATLRRRAARVLWCNARSTAAAFYRQHGFTVDGAEFVQAETGLPHVRMWRGLDRPGVAGPVRGRFPTGRAGT